MSTIQPSVRPATPARPPRPHGGQPAGAPAVGPKPKPKPRPQPAPAAPTPFYARPVFQATTQVNGTLTTTKNPIEGVGSLAVMPVAIAVDLADLFTRPLQALFTGGR